MRESVWMILGSYLRQYLPEALMFLGFAVIFAGVFFLYGLPADAVLYAAQLCALLAAVVLALHFIRYYRAHRQRRRILDNILLAEELPRPQTLAEADYQEMLAALRKHYDANVTGWENERRESIDYYTAWAHQIKTPISVMRMILRGEDTNEHRELSAELFRIEQYVEMVLSYLRLGSESSDYVFQEYELDDIIRKAIRKYAPQFVRRRLRLSYEPAQARVLTDEKWLLFILEQILSNAVKYTPFGAVEISVSQEKILRIADTGIGIAPEDIPRIFEKGFTGYNGRMERKSTGLGLYLCRTAADRLHHRIWVESVVGKGTTVYLDLHRDPLEVE